MVDISVEASNIIKDKRLTHRQKMSSLARLSLNATPYPKISDKAKALLESKVICDMYEGSNPYVPRYVLPDYKLLFEKGCEFLGLKAPNSLLGAVMTLLNIYQYVPSVTGYPVYLGNVDELLDPYYNGGEAEDELLRWYLISISRSIPDAFAHMNIGPRDTKVGRAILRLDKELLEPVPNISLKWDESTGDQLLEHAIDSALVTSKPHIHNHALNVSDLGERYGVVSCYNSLPIGGGAHTLVRMNLRKLAVHINKGVKDFLEELKGYIHTQCEIIMARREALINSGFYEEHFLVREGFIDKNNFLSMAGIFGMAECIGIISELEGEKLQFGKDKGAQDIAIQILDTFQSVLSQYQGIELHAQSGISEDIEETAGSRVPVGTEPHLYDHIDVVAPLHKYYRTGVSDIFLFESTAKSNLTALATIIKSAFKKGLRTFTLNSSDSEMVRITGYLIKRVDVDKYSSNAPIREGSGDLGAEAYIKQNLANRKVNDM